MPILKFKCETCGNVFDELVKQGVTEGVACDRCGESNTKRAYEGKCSFGAKAGGHDCGGSCASCAGCGG